MVKKLQTPTEIPDMPKDKRTKAYKEWVKQYGVQEVTSINQKKNLQKVSKSKPNTSGLDKLDSDFIEKIDSDDLFNKRKDIEELRSKINSTLKSSESDTDEYKKSKYFFQTLKLTHLKKDISKI